MSSTTPADLEKVPEDGRRKKGRKSGGTTRFSIEGSKEPESETRCRNSDAKSRSPSRQSEEVMMPVPEGIRVIMHGTVKQIFKWGKATIDVEYPISFRHVRRLAVCYNPSHPRNSKRSAKLEDLEKGTYIQFQWSWCYMKNTIYYFANDVEVVPKFAQLSANAPPFEPRGTSSSSAVLVERSVSVITNAIVDPGSRRDQSARMNSFGSGRFPIRNNNWKDDFHGHTGCGDGDKLVDLKISVVKRPEGQDALEEFVFSMESLYKRQFGNRFNFQFANGEKYENAYVLNDTELDVEGCDYKWNAKTLISPFKLGDKFRLSASRVMGEAWWIITDIKNDSITVVTALILEILDNVFAQEDLLTPSQQAAEEDVLSATTTVAESMSTSEHENPVTEIIRNLINSKAQGLEVQETNEPIVEMLQISDIVEELHVLGSNELPVLEHEDTQYVPNASSEEFQTKEEVQNDCDVFDNNTSWKREILPNVSDVLLFKRSEEQIPIQDVSSFYESDDVLEWLAKAPKVTEALLVRQQCGPAKVFSDIAIQVTETFDIQDKQVQTNASKSEKEVGEEYCKRLLEYMKWPKVMIDAYVVEFFGSFTREE